MQNSVIGYGDTLDGSANILSIKVTLAKLFTFHSL